MAAPAPVPLETLLAHREWVRRVALALVRDENLARDLEQDLWVKALEKPPVVRGSVRGWIAATLRNLRIDGVRSEASRRRREQSIARPERHRATNEIVAEAEGMKRVVVAVMDLAEPYRLTVLLRYFEDLPPRDIAARQGVPVETVRTRLKRAVATLRERFDAEGGGAREWRLALLPLLGSRESAIPSAAGVVVVALGGVLMAKKAGVAVAVAAILLAFAGGAAWWGSHPGAREPTGSPPAPTVPAGRTAPPAEPVTSVETKRETALPLVAIDPQKPDELSVPSVVARVFDETRRPVAGARATLRVNGEPVAEGSADADGNLLLPKVAYPDSGRYFLNLVVRDAANRVARRTVSGGAYGAAVARGKYLLPTMILGDLVVRPARAVDVRVLAGGRSVPGAFVHAEADMFESDARTDEVPTDDEGRARIGDLWDGGWVVYARSPAFGRGRAAVTAAPGEAGTVEVSLSSREVEVTVVEAGSGSPVEGAALEISVAHDTPRWTHHYVEEHPAVEAPPTDSAGRTAIAGLGRDEALRIEVVRPGMSTSESGVPSTHVPGGENSVRIELPSQRTVRFLVARDRGVPPVEGDLVSVGVRKIPVEGGALVVGGLPPSGPVRLLARAPDGAVAILRAAPGAAEGEEAVFLPTRTLTVTVRDEDGKPVTDSGVYLFDGEGEKRSQRIEPDAEGRTRIERIVAGEYVVTAGATWDFGGGEVARVDLSDGDRSLDVVLGREFAVLARITVDGIARLPGDLKCQALNPHPWKGLEGRENLAGKEDPARGEVRYRVRPLRPGAPVRLRFETPRYAPGCDVAPPPPGQETVVNVALK